MIINNHLLKSAKQQPSPNHSGDFSEGQLDTIIIHYTASSSARSAASWLCNPKARASAHVVIDKSGRIIQLVPFNKIAWHAGKSKYENRTGFNKYAIGIEIDNAGELTKAGSKFRAWWGRIYPENVVFSAAHKDNPSQPRHWEIFTEKQIQKVRELCEELIDVYGIKQVLGHDEIAKGRKLDPGPAFPIDKLKSLLFGDRK